ncbi:FmdB family zinc ribbon protein [Microbacterium sp. MYb66]|jgi:putative FmdB family regulatory protein|uniref:FmdB family zinc ribbon protein n=1 Tax=Microbacterium sp. MYb66 TaxID=1848692 RepID=UPI000CFF58B9|nr:FmdB family zinc ribbon protein [Microbacterium sp. MYb66]PRA80854.1 FmdB family transcriptional regulator [Microbacterium sp. MYb66]
MPTYAYACRSCGHQFDAVQSFSEDALSVCPECGGELRKQYGSIGVTFNGSGFYRTDSRAKSGGTKDASASSKTESTTSAKPAAASTPASS